MADNNQVNVQYGLDVSQATAEAARLTKQINLITSGLLGSQKIIESNLKSMTADLSAAMEKVKNDTVQMNRLLRSEDRVRGNILRSQGRGGKVAQVTGAAGDSIIADARNTAEQVTARITDALVNAFTQRMRTIDNVVEARLRQAQFNTAQVVANATPEMLQARSFRAERNRTTLLNRASDPELIAAEDIRRESNRRRLIRETQDVEDQLAKEKLAELNRQRRIDRANAPPPVVDGELVGAQNTRNARRRMNLIQQEKDTLDLEAKRIIGEQARERRLARAGISAKDEELAAAQKARNDRRRLELIQQEKDALDLENRRILAEAARTRRAQRADAILNPQAAPVKEKKAPLSLEERTARGFDATFSRLNSNNGADIISVQSRIMANYAALAIAFNSLRSLSSFVVDLDKQFRQFQAITATTSTEMEGLKNELIEVSQQSKFSAVEIADAAVVLGQAGLSARQVADSINAVQLLATAAGTDLSSAVDTVTSTMSIFNLQTSQTTDVANTLTAALNLSKLDLDKLTLGLQYSGNIAAQVGLTYQELTGVLGALANSGIRSGSTLGTGLRQLIIDIQNPAEKFTKVLKQLGLSQQDVSIESNGLVPVLKTLSEAGFGASEAFESFEVRAAASYVALANNIDLATELQQQFTLSTAAIQANDVQMDALANTFTRFTSIMGTVAYRAFEPFLKVLQQAIEATANFLSKLDDIPNLLPALGTALAVGATALTVSTVSSLIRGVIQAIPLFSSLGTAAAAATGPMTALFAVASKINPLVALVSTLVGVVTAFAAFGTEAETTADRLDMMQSQVNEFKGQVSSANEQVEAINQTVANLVRQKAALDKDPLIRQAKILEVKQGFKEIGDEVSTTTGTVVELIDALRNLANADFKKIGESMGAALEANRALISGYQLSIVEQLQQSPMNMEDSARPIQRTGTVLPNQLQVGDDAYRASISGAYGQLLGDSRFTDYADMAFNRRNLPEDVTEIQTILNSLQVKQDSLRTQQNTLTTSKKLGTITPAELRALESIPQQLEMIAILRSNLEPIVNARINIASRESENAIMERDLRRNQIRSSDQYTDISKMTDLLGAEVGTGFNDVLKSIAGQPADVAVKALQDFEAAYKQRMLDLGTQTNEKIEELSSETGIDQDEIRSVMEETLNYQRTLQNRIATKINADNLEFQKLEAARLADEMSTLDDQLGTFRKQLTRSYTADEIDQVREFVLRKFDEKRKLMNEIYAAKTGATEDPTEQSTIANELREKQKQINVDEQTAIADLVQASVDQQISVVNETKTAIDEQIAATQSKMAQLLTAISNAKPGPAMDALIAQFNTLSEAMQTMQGQSNALGVTSGIGSTVKKVVPESQTAKANQAMAILQGLGYSKQQAAGIVGNLVAESGMSTTAVGDHGTAFGLAQWRGPRQAELRQFASDRGTSADDFETQLRFIDQELKKYTTFGLKELMASRSAGEAADVFRRRFERPTSDPIKGAHGERIAYANTLGSTDFNSQLNSQAQNQLKLINAQADASMRAINERVTKAQLALSSAQDPINAGRYTESQVLGLQRELDSAERTAKIEELAAAEQRLAAIRRELSAATAMYGAESEQALFWQSEEARVIAETTKNVLAKNAADQALIQTGPSVDAAIRSATEAWRIQNGLIDELSGNMVPLAKQVEQVWGSVLDNLTTGFSTLFTDLVSGTMTAEDAFRKFAVSVIDGLAQIIAKQLALQLVSGMMGDSGDGGMGDFFAGLFGVPGAAQGEIIKGGPPRDHQLRRVMPGEAILRASAVSAIGADKLRTMNSLGNRSISQSPINSPINDNAVGGGVMNVWVVSPDQVPPPGPNDIIAAVSDNINRRGTIRQLIKSVAMGTI